MANADEQPPGPSPGTGEPAAAGEAVLATRPGATVKRDKTLEWDLRTLPQREIAVGGPPPAPAESAPSGQTTSASAELVEPGAAGWSGRALLDLPLARLVPLEAAEVVATTPGAPAREQGTRPDSEELEVELEGEAAAGDTGSEPAPATPEPMAPRIDEASRLGAAPEGPAPLIEDSTAPLPVEETRSGGVAASELPTPAPVRARRTPAPPPTAEGPGGSAPAPPGPTTPPPVTPPPMPAAALASQATVARTAGAPARADGSPRVPPIPAAALDQVAAAGAPAWAEPLKPRPRAKRAKPWFEEVFDEDYLRTLPFMTAEQTLREANFIHDCVGVPPGGEILDVGCGYGRHAIELAQRGLKVTGLDLSLPLLIRAADESQRRGLSVNFVHADMREMSFDAQFDGAYCALTTFGYFDEETNLKVATGICKALRPGGKFLLDVLNRDYIVADLPTRVWWEGDGCVVLEEVDFNFHTSRVGIRRSIVFQDGRQFEHDISIRAYSLHELGRLLRQAGLRVIEVSGGIATRGRFFGATSRSMITLCEKPAL